MFPVHRRRMDELQRINHIPDREARLKALHKFMADEWDLLQKLGEPCSQALTSARASAKGG